MPLAVPLNFSSDAWPLPNMAGLTFLSHFTQSSLSSVGTFPAWIESRTYFKDGGSANLRVHSSVRPVNLPPIPFQWKLSEPLSGPGCTSRMLENQRPRWPYDGQSRLVRGRPRGRGFKSRRTERTSSLLLCTPARAVRAEIIIIAKVSKSVANLNYLWYLSDGKSSAHINFRRASVNEWFL